MTMVTTFRLHHSEGIHYSTNKLQVHGFRFQVKWNKTTFHLRTTLHYIPSIVLWLTLNASQRYFYVILLKISHLSIGHLTALTLKLYGPKYLILKYALRGIYLLSWEINVICYIQQLMRWFSWRRYKIFSDLSSTCRYIDI